MINFLHAHRQSCHVSYYMLHKIIILISIIAAVKSQIDCKYMYILYIAVLTVLLIALRKELDATKLKYNEASEKLMEKSRQYQKLQGLYDTLRR